MANDEKSVSGIPISGALATIALILGIIVIPQLPFKPSRPIPPVTSKSALHEGEDVQARLWQDPFSAVMIHKQSTTSDPYGHSVTQLAKQIFLRTDPNDVFKKQIVVLGVMVSGGPYAEDVERRTRYRYAVLSALGELDYSPEDSEHIGYLENLDFSANPYPIRLVALLTLESFESAGSLSLQARMFDTCPYDQCEKSRLLELVPYEWFQSKDNLPLSVLVLWLDDGRFFESPLRKLSDFTGLLNKAVGIKSSVMGRTAPELKYEILGPESSTNLKGMIEENALDPDHKQNLENVQMFSWAATVDMEKLVPAREDEKEAPNSLGKEIENKTIINGNNGFKFFRTIGPDRILTDLLVRELDLRIEGMIPKKKEPDSWIKKSVHWVLINILRMSLTQTDTEDEEVHIALISEWDTVYGRNLPDAFIRSVAEKHHLDPKQIDWIRKFSYMRGIDGQVPGQKQVQSPIAKTSKKNNTDSEEQDIERPVGRNQFDYLRRLAFRLKKWDENIRKKNGKRGIQAIGVLGSDVYDKLLVLQAMHKLFPAVIFFTTDMDARLFHPDELLWTQNLIVASHYGLRLGRKLQENVPPFRDNYQTSLFLSTKVALDDPAIPPHKPNEWLGSPRIFEIGRTGAFALPVKYKKPEKISSIQEEINSIHPPLHSHGRTWMYSKHLWSVFGTAILFTIVFLAFYHQCWRGRGANKNKEYKPHLLPPCFLLLFLILLVTLLTLIISSQFNGGEPFAFFEGISIWPSEFLRFLAGGISLYFLIAGFLKARASDQELSEKFFNAHSPRAENGQVARTTKGAIGKSLEAPYIWDEYEKYTTWEFKLWKYKFWKFKTWRFKFWNLRFLRILILSAIYFILCRFIINLFGEPFIPYRGDTSHWIHIIALLFSIPLFIFLLIATVDVTVASRWLIRRLSRDRIIWPEAAAREISTEFNMKPAHLNEWINIQVIVKISETAGRFIYYPFIVILILGAARLRYFDRWNMPVGLLIVIMLGLSYSVYCAVSLRSAARTAKEETLQRLWKKELSLTGYNDKLLCEQIKMLYKSIESMRKGPFVPFFEQPFVRAVALFLGGGGGLVALNYL